MRMKHNAGTQEFNGHLRAFFVRNDFYAYDVRWDAASKRIESFRFTLELQPLTSVEDKVKLQRIVVD